MKSEFWHVTLKADSKGSARRELLGVIFDRNDPEARTKRLKLTEGQRAELEATGDYGFRHAAEDPRPAAPSLRERAKGATAQPAARPAAPDPPVPAETDSTPQKEV